MPPLYTRDICLPSIGAPSGSTAVNLLEGTVWRENANDVNGRFGEIVGNDLFATHLHRAHRPQITEHTAGCVAQKYALECPFGTVES